MSSSNNLECSWKEIIIEASWTGAGLQKKWNISCTATAQIIKLSLQMITFYFLRFIGTL